MNDENKRLSDIIINCLKEHAPKVEIKEERIHNISSEQNIVKSSYRQKDDTLPAQLHYREEVRKYLSGESKVNHRSLEITFKLAGMTTAKIVESYNLDLTIVNENALKGFQEYFIPILDETYDEDNPKNVRIQGHKLPEGVLIPLKQGVVDALKESSQYKAFFEEKGGK